MANEVGAFKADQLSCHVRRFRKSERQGALSLRKEAEMAERKAEAGGSGGWTVTAARMCLSVDERDWDEFNRLRNDGYEYPAFQA